MTPSERKDYWRGLLDYMKNEGLLLSHRDPYTETWQIIDEWSRYSIRLAARLNAQNHWIHVDLTLLGPNREEYFDRLRKESGKIQGEILDAISPSDSRDLKLKWEKSAPNHPKECWIILPKSDDPADRRSRQTQHEWLARVLVAFRQAFGKRIDSW